MAKEKCCICYDPKLDALIYQSKATLENLSNEIVKSLSYGYSCDKNAKPKMDLLQNYLYVLEDENRKIALGGKPCLNCYVLQSLAEKVRKLTTSCNIALRKDLIIDRSEEEAWIAENPYCVSREKWERIAHIVCEAFNLDIKIVEVTKDCDLDLEVMSVETVCDLTFEIVRNIIPCDIILAISAYQEACDLGLTITRSEEECKIDFDLLVEEVNCDLDLKAYQKLIECNLSFDVIKTVYENGCSFNIGDPVTLVTPMNEYPIEQLKFSGTPDMKLLKRLKIDISDSKFAKSPKSFIKALKQDYGSSK
ncbi:hypothetical protein KC573_03540 [candidate division WWE3 bacterium]|uniref:Uncharacterized protein n=1 Tax=candidate division WWE3 bacterium TaxID=2053526 RepID=A0A955LW70_UNCKA|nr:hypothetical protein [candidate division WWE3 bacterium]